MTKRPVPAGYHTITPYLVTSDATTLLAFLARAFDAELLERQDAPGGGVHCELRIGDSRIMVGQRPGAAAMPAMFHLYVPDADETYQRALSAGATSIEAPNDAPYGDRRAAVQDGAGNQWYLAHRR